MRRLQEALNDRMKPERTRALLLQEYVRLGGTGELLQGAAAFQRATRPELSAAELIARSYDSAAPRRPAQRRSSGDELLDHAMRILGVASAIAQIDFFIQEDRPRIKEAFRLRAMKRDLFVMAREHMALNTEDLAVGRTFMQLQELLYERSLQLAPSAPAVGLMASRSGPPIAYLARLVVASLYPNGYDWAEIAALVDDGGDERGRPERLRKMHETDPLKTMRKRLQGPRPEPER